jgi:hypothetical protein
MTLQWYALGYLSYWLGQKRTFNLRINGGSFDSILVIVFICPSGPLFWLTSALMWTGGQVRDKTELVERRMGGNIGLFLQSRTLKPLGQFIYENFDQSPVDWLVSEYMVHASSCFSGILFVCCLCGRCRFRKSWGCGFTVPPFYSTGTLCTLLRPSIFNTRVDFR